MRCDRWRKQKNDMFGVADGPALLTTGHPFVNRDAGSALPHKTTLISQQFFYSLLYPPLARVFLLDRSASRADMIYLGGEQDEVTLSRLCSSRGPSNQPNKSKIPVCQPTEKFVRRSPLVRESGKPERACLALAPGAPGGWLRRLASLPVLLGV